MSKNNNISQEIKQIIAEIPLADKNLSFFLSDIIYKDNKYHLIINLPTNLRINTKELEKDLLTRLKNSSLQENEFNIIIHAKKSETKQLHKLENIQKILLVAAAKGGVGKSTCATNIALAIAKQGKKVGIVDADIYGPTIPKLLGINQKPEVIEQKLLPIYKHNIHSISIGNLIDEDKATIWRGPMVTKALFQLIAQVKWPSLDYLIIDMPPGTGDVYLSLAENFTIDGVILVTTPQNIASSMLKKSINFFKTTNIPVIGIVENMSYFEDETGKKHFLFGVGNTNEEFGLPILEKIGLSSKISKFSDQGKTITEEPEFSKFENIAQKISS